MRDQDAMMKLILETAKKDERILAVYMNGSRVNAKVVPDNYQDYDIVYVVRDTRPMIEDPSWLEVFGRPLMVQEPDSNDFGWGSNHDFKASYAWLMLFEDGNRIDLTIQSKDFYKEVYGQDSLTKVLLDKEGLLWPLPEANDSDYHIKPPTEGQYYGTCNEFWWCLNNVIKGLARDELTYTMWMYHEVVRPMLHRMLDWSIGIDLGFDLSVGKKGKAYKDLLPKDLYEAYKATYSSGEVEAFLEALHTACDLFGDLAPKIGAYFGYDYKVEEELGMRRYIAMVEEEIKKL